MPSLDALYYPFHLCHEQTLHRLLAEYHTVHFRDFMALQLTPFMGTTAFPDRMGDYYPEFVKTGRIVQGYDLSGPLTTKLIGRVNDDLACLQWRTLFHEALNQDRRFQRGLFPSPPEVSSDRKGVEDDLLWETFSAPRWAHRHYQVQDVQTLSGKRLQGEENLQFEYGWALVKTAAAHVYTIDLCQGHGLIAVTDSGAHHTLLEHTCKREGIRLENRFLKRTGY